MSNQVKLPAEARTELGKGASGRLRRQGMVPGILYGYKVEPAAVAVEARALYHALHTEAGANALIQLTVEDQTYLTVARELQRHPVRGDTVHVDFLAVDQDSQILVEVPVHIVGDEEVSRSGGVVSQILHTLSIMVKPLDVPNFVELSVEGMEIGDVKRVEDLVSQLPQSAELAIDADETLVTITAPVSEEELAAMEESAGVEGEEPELVGEEASEEADEG